MNTNRTRQESNKINYIKHYDKIRAYANIKYTCECGTICRKSDKARHERSKKHQAFMNTSLEYP